MTLPALGGAKKYDLSRAFASFRWITISMMFMVIVMTGADMMQVYREGSRDGITRP